MGCVRSKPSEEIAITAYYSLGKTADLCGHITDLKNSDAFNNAACHNPVYVPIFAPPGGKIEGLVPTRPSRYNPVGPIAKAKTPPKPLRFQDDFNSDCQYVHVSTSEEHDSPTPNPKNRNPQSAQSSSQSSKTSATSRRMATHNHEEHCLMENKEISKVAPGADLVNDKEQELDPSCERTTISRTPSCSSITPVRRYPKLTGRTTKSCLDNTARGDSGFYSYVGVAYDRDSSRPPSGFYVEPYQSDSKRSSVYGFDGETFCPSNRSSCYGFFEDDLDFEHDGTERGFSWASVASAR